MHFARTFAALGVLVVPMVALAERDARACGGCVAPPPPPHEVESVITDEKMIFSISKDTTTLYDQIEYSGAPSSFAWVLPIKGTVTVGLSADILFSTVELLTATQVVPPTPACRACNYGSGGSFGSGTGGSSGTGSSGGGVVVTSQKQVGPYETVQLHSSDGTALTNWLSSHGYTLPAADKPVVDAYVAEHFDFLALKLVPGKGVKAMQPVRVTSIGAAPSLPLHMVAVGTGPTTGITIWVFADGRWEPANFPTFTIADSDLTWDWLTYSSNYESLRLSKEAAHGGRGWQIESSLEISKALLRADLLSAIQYDPTGDGLYTPLPSGDAGASGGDAPASDASAAGDATADGAAVADTGAAEDLAAEEDLKVLFAGIRGGNVRVTRMRSDVSHAALSVDMRLQAAADPSELTNLHFPGHQIGQPPCPCGVLGSAGTSGTGAAGGRAGSGGAGGSAPRAAAPAESGGGCSTTGGADETGATVAVFLAAVGFVAARARQRRRRRP